MTRIVVAILICMWALPAAAESSVLDFSRPMTGKSRHAINSDGSPLELGAPAQVEPDPILQPQPESGGAIGARCGGGACRSGGISAGVGAERPKTVHVNSYTRKDGTFVGSHMRSAPRRR
jgi:hypothetical protein